MIDTEVELDYEESVLFSLKKQSRTIRTIDVLNSTTNTTSCQIESDLAEWRDYAFQLLIVGSGPCAINSVRMFMQNVPENTSGECTKDETSEDNNVRFDGTGSEDLVALETGPEIFSSTKSVTVSYDGEEFVAEATSYSFVSQADADKQATSKAQVAANAWLASVEPYIYGDPSNALP